MYFLFLFACMSPGDAVYELFVVLNYSIQVGKSRDVMVVPILASGIPTD